MMFGRGGDARRPSDHLFQVVAAGAQGARRLVEDRQELGPLPAALPGAARIDASWVQMCTDAGFEDVQAVPVVNEAAVVRATKANTSSS